jgi:AraC-like DNA-binding protein/uncharacterized cupin superfamily protein
MSLPTMDALSDILKTVHLSASTYFCRSFGSPWNMRIRHRPQGIFHVVVEGQCYLREGNNEELILLKAGDIVAFPTGGAHWLCDQPDSQHLSAENVVKVGNDSDLLLLKSGNIIAFPTGGSHWASTPNQEANTGDAVTTLLCGTISYDSTVNHPFLKDLPCFIQISTADDSEFDWLKSLVNVLENESKQSSPGSTLMVDRLTEILFIQLLRAHMQQMKTPTGYMAALADVKIGVALNLIHAETDEKWTVDSLSKAAALSRTSFTEKFSALVGSSPKAYLTHSRMLKAKNKLQHSDDSMLSIAESAGYSSEAAFSKALKKHFNMTPGQIRGASR